MNKKVEIEQIISELNIRLTERYNDFHGIYFFGSRTKDTYNMVFVFDRKINWRFRKEIIKIVYDIELKYDIFIDAKVYNNKEISEPITPFRQAVINEGIFYAGR